MFQAAGFCRRFRRSPPAPVKVASAQLRNLPVEIKAIGNVEAFTTISVKAQLGGTIMKVRFTEGSPVKKGDLLFEIDPRPYQEAIKQIEANLARDNSMLAQAEANLARDRAQEKFARAQAGRYEDLAKQGVFSKEQSEAMSSDAQAKAESVKADLAAIESARSSMNADRAALDNAKLQLGYCFIYSPVNGRTGNISVKEGNLVKANDVELVSIMQVEPIYVTFTVPESQLPGIRARMRSGKLARPRDPEGRCGYHRRRRAELHRQLRGPDHRDHQVERHVFERQRPPVARAVCRCRAPAG